MRLILSLVTIIWLSFSPGVLFSQDDYSDADTGPNGRLKEAATAMRNRNFRDAEEIYRTLVNENPDDLALQQLLCHALMNQKKFTECDSMLRRMVAKDTNNAGNYWYMGLSSERQGLDSMAAYWFKYFITKTTRFDAKSSKAYLHVGSAYRRKMHKQGINNSEFDDMVYYYKAYLKINPGDPYAGDLERFIENVSSRKPETGGNLIWDESSP